MANRDVRLALWSGTIFPFVGFSLEEEALRFVTSEHSGLTTFCRAFGFGM
ncbi:Uncharacterised protein [Actinobacillus pleuropneumoniae]|nr:Uncharacterised protein [Actinobacillus pleuropneumoniae]